MKTVNLLDVQLQVLLYPKPNFAPAFQGRVDSRVRMKSGIVSSTKFRKVRKHDVSEWTFLTEDLIIRNRFPLQSPFKDINQFPDHCMTVPATVLLPGAGVPDAFAKPATAGAAWMAV